MPVATNNLAWSHSMLVKGIGLGNAILPGLEERDGSLFEDAALGWGRSWELLCTAARNMRNVHPVMETMKESS